MFPIDHDVSVIEIVISSIYVSDEVEKVRLKVSGDGSLEYHLDAFKAALIASGFTSHTVDLIKITRGNEE